MRGSRAAVRTENKMNSSTTRNLFLLYDFIQNGDAESLRRHLSSHNTDINTVLPCKGVGLLHLAVGIEPESASVECTDVLLKRGADPNLCSEEGATPVHVAAVWGRLAALRLLLACGGDPARRDHDARDACHYAAREGHARVLRYLRRACRGCDGALDEREGSDNEGSYTLQLDRVLVSTGHVVAEYAPVSEDHLRGVPECRKSEMVREWCEKTSLVVNRLYPTILNHTYLIQDESLPWKPGDFTGDSLNATNISNNVAKKSEVGSPNETKTSYKSCFSKKLSPEELGISGIQVLQETIAEEDPNCDCTCHEVYTKRESCSRRVSVYENFSLPGSPTTIIHQNYKTKTSLRKNKASQGKSSPQTDNSKNSSSNSNNKTIENKTIMTSDQSTVLTVDANDKATDGSDEFYYVDYRSLNDALAIVQNETNEWLSQSNSSNDSDAHLTADVIELNDSDEHLATDAIEVGKDAMVYDGKTRRASQRSSGVNSSASGSSIAIASVQEEYKYEDNEEDVVLIEKRLIIPSVVLPVDEELSGRGSPERSRRSMASSLPASIDYDAARLRTELRACGFDPGPITAATKKLYLRKLKNLKKGAGAAEPREAARPTYSVELEKSLRNESWFNDLAPYVALENAVRADFANPRRAGAWREGSAKTSFTYLLLDPRLTDNLPVRAGKQTQHATWTMFVNSIFYVGKGKRSRPYSHLYQALTLWKRDFKSCGDKKVQHILDIWGAQVGVVCLHVFQNVIPAEAYTYEACMIDVLGLPNLKNLKGGNYYGVAGGWPLRDRRMLGLYLLYKAMLIFLSEGERQLRPGDID